MNVMRTTYRGAFIGIAACLLTYSNKPLCAKKVLPPTLCRSVPIELVEEMPILTSFVVGSTAASASLMIELALALNCLNKKLKEALESPIDYPGPFGELDKETLKQAIEICLKHSISETAFATLKLPPEELIDDAFSSLIRKLQSQTHDWENDLLQNPPEIVLRHLWKIGTTQLNPDQSKAFQAEWTKSLVKRNNF